MHGDQARCECRPGYQLAEDAKTCEGNLYLVQTVEFVSHAYRIYYIYYILHTPEIILSYVFVFMCLHCVFFASDIDECQTGQADCAHGCHNTRGSFMCVCPAAYELGVDGKQCYREYDLMSENTHLSHMW